MKASMFIPIFDRMPCNGELIVVDEGS